MFKKSFFKNYICISKLWVLKFGSWLIFSIYLFDIGLNYQSAHVKNIKKNFKELNFKYLKQIKIFKFKNYLYKNRKLKKIYLFILFKKFKKFFKIRSCINNKNKKLYFINKYKTYIKNFKFKILKKKKKEKFFEIKIKIKKLMNFFLLKKIF